MLAAVGGTDSVCSVFNEVLIKGPDPLRQLITFCSISHFHHKRQRPRSPMPPPSHDLRLLPEAPFAHAQRESGKPDLAFRCLERLEIKHNKKDGLGGVVWA